MSELDRLDYYTLLGVDDEASIARIKQAFKIFARRYHPDRHAGAATEKRERATAIYRRGTEAFQVLTDPVTRAAYDAALEKGHLRLTNEAREQNRRAAPAKKRRRKIPIRSPQARHLFDDAVDATKRKDWDTALRAMRGAVKLEPDNEFLRERLSQVERHIASMR